ENCAQEPEVDELIKLLNTMGGNIKRTSDRTIEVDGVKKLNGTTFRINSDRNEAVTFAVASALTGGNIWLKNVEVEVLVDFINEFRTAGGEMEEESEKGIRFYIKEK